MASKHDRDISLERLLRQSLRAPESPAPGSCLDAEALAAWADGTIAAAERAAAEAHVAGCQRCLAILATMAKIRPSSPASQPWWARGLTVRWLVPLTAATVAVAVWVIVPRHDVTLLTPALETDFSSRSVAPQPQQPAAAPEKPPASVVGGALSKQTDERVSEAAAKSREAMSTQAQATRQESVTISGETPATDGVAPPQRPNSAPPASLPAGVAGGIAESVQFGARALADRSNAGTIEVISPEPSSRWRIGARGLIQHSVDNGANWETLASGTAADLTAGSSPSPQVCWVVGRSGTVLLSSDGRRWQRLMFPEVVDLVGIQAPDARNASVKTVDGRTFATTDGGLTWRLQGF